MHTISKNENRKNKGNFKDSIDDILGVITTEKVEYFAQKDEKFNIIVHLYNPSRYEILSFTLNDYKYQSYEFKEGSNSEELIIEVDAGAISGLKEYTIDAIKYIDGTEIKDVKMEIFNVYMIYRIYNFLVVKHTMHILNLVTHTVTCMGCWDCDGRLR